MRTVGLALFLVGIVVAACFAARPVARPGDTGVSPSDRISRWTSSAGVPFAFGMLLVVGGGLLARRARRRGAIAAAHPVGEHQGYGPEGAGDLPSREQPGIGTQDREPIHPELGPRYVLAAITQKLEELPLERVSHDARKLHAVLDEILEQDVPAFLSHRERLIARMGLGQFAEMIGAFAMMERNASRAWSAIIDEAWDEVTPCIRRARSGVADAGRMLG
jgi:hypothetical protein